MMKPETAGQQGADSGPLLWYRPWSDTWDHDMFYELVWMEPRPPKTLRYQNLSGFHENALNKLYTTISYLSWQKYS